MSVMAPPLPYRPLEVRGHGVWDPASDRFYPFRVATKLLYQSVDVRAGVMYYVRRVYVTAINEGDHANSEVYMISSSCGTPVYVFRARVAASTAASGVSASISTQIDVDVLTDPGVDITVGSAPSVTAGYYHLVYAEIPVDEGEIA